MRGYTQAMERNEISQHEVLVYLALANSKAWMTNRDIADQTGVAPRTARAHTLKLVQLGLVEQAEIFPAHRYRLSDHAAKRNRGYFDRITRAIEILGPSLHLKADGDT